MFGAASSTPSTRFPKKDGVCRVAVETRLMVLSRGDVCSADVQVSASVTSIVRPEKNMLMFQPGICSGRSSNELKR